MLFRSQQNEATNALVKGFADDKKVFFLDIGAKFLEADGTLSKTIMPDLLHPNEKGYQIWTDAIEAKAEKFAEMEARDGGGTIKKATFADIPGAAGALRGLACRGAQLVHRLRAGHHVDQVVHRRALDAAEIVVSLFVGRLGRQDGREVRDLHAPRARHPHRVHALLQSAALRRACVAYVAADGGADGLPHP